jgi:hypothetical protein
MIIRYRMNSSCTLANLKTDLHNIISGNITTTADFSAGCDKTNSVIYGTYPAGIYSVANAGTYTYSKVHGDYGSGTTHYFRLSFDSTKLTGITLAQSYTSGSDTLVNSQSLSTEVVTNYNYSQVYTGLINVNTIYRSSSNIAVGQKVELASNTQFDLLNTPPGLRIVSKPNAGFTGTGTTGSYALNKYVTVAAGAYYDHIIKSEVTSLNISPTTYSAVDAPYGIDIVITNKCFFISAQAANTHLGIFDIGKNGVTREWTSSMLMAGVDLSGGLQSLAKIPYSYKYSTLSYGTNNDVVLVRNNPVKQYKASGSIAILENPIFLQYPDAGNAIATTYGLYAIAPSAYAMNSVYTDGSTYRLVVNDFAILGA